MHVLLDCPPKWFSPPNQRSPPPYLQPWHIHPLAPGTIRRAQDIQRRATGIITYLQNGGKVEISQQMAGHEFALMTGLYDRRNDSVALDEIENITY